MPYSNFIKFCAERGCLTQYDLNLIKQPGYYKSIFKIVYNEIVFHINKSEFSPVFKQLTDQDLIKQSELIIEIQKIKDFCKMVLNKTPLNGKDYREISLVIYSIFTTYPNICLMFILYCDKLIEIIRNGIKPFFELGTQIFLPDTDDILRCYSPISDYLIIAQNSKFVQSLLSYFEKKMCDELILNKAGDVQNNNLIWARDPVVYTSRGFAFSDSDARTFVNYPFKITGLYKKYAHFIKFDENIYDFSSHTRDLNSEEKKSFESYHFKFQLSHALKLAGGNVVKALNLKHELIYIVGITAVLEIMHIAYFDESMNFHLNEKQKQRCEDSVTNLDFYKRFKTIKRLIRKFLINDPEDSNKRVMFVDMVSYHIDLDILYLSPGTIAVNSYKEFLNLAEDVRNLENGQYKSYKLFYSDQYKHMFDLYENRLDHLSSQLQKRAFNVIRVAGSSLNFEPSELFDKHPFYKSEKFQIKEIVYTGFCFMNSIVVQFSNQPSDFELLIPCSHPEKLNPFRRLFFNKFVDKLKSVGILHKIVHIETDGRMITYELKSGSRINLKYTVETFLSVTEGGLRCSVNKVPHACVSTIDSTQEPKKLVLDYTEPSLKKHKKEILTCEMSRDLFNI